MKRISNEVRCLVAVLLLLFGWSMATKGDTGTSLLGLAVLIIAAIQIVLTIVYLEW
jgi:hypothetical protein